MPRDGLCQEAPVAGVEEQRSPGQGHQLRDQRRHLQERRRPQARHAHSPGHQDHGPHLEGPGGDGPADDALLLSGHRQPGSAGHIMASLNYTFKIGLAAQDQSNEILISQHLLY